MDSNSRLPVVFISVLMTSWVGLTSTEIYTSSFKVHTMVMEEERLLKELKSYIDRQYDRLKLLSNFYTDRLREVNFRQNSGLDLTHPNAVYNVLKRYASVYTPILKEKLEIFSAVLKQSGKTFVADASDEQGAKESLLRIQNVYNLEAMDMVKGDYLGYQGPQLQPVDAYEIGKVAFSQGKLNASVDWLNTSLTLYLRSRFDTASPTLHELSPGDVKALLGRVYIRNGRPDLASELLNEVKLLGCKHPDVGTLEEELNQHTPTFTPEPPHSDFMNFSRLCNLEKGIYPAKPNSPQSVCRYRQALLPYYIFQEEILSVSPFASVIYNVITDKEGDHLKDHVRHRAVDSTTSNPLILGRQVERIFQPLGYLIPTAHVVSQEDKLAWVLQWCPMLEQRISWIEDHASSITASLSRRIECITGLDVTQRLPGGPSSGESLQIANYGLGGHYGVHMDTLDAPSKTRDLAKAGDRLATFLIYLSDVERGGATVFPRAGVSVAPIKNMALLWYNFDPALQREELTHHAGCPVLIGQKWIANKWIWTHGNTFRRRCALRPDATQLDIEADMRRMYTSA